MKLVEKIQLSDQEYELYSRLCKAEKRSLRGQTAILIQNYLRTGK
jgi:hypothetical protein